MRYSIIIFIVLLASKALCQPSNTKQEAINKICYLTDMGFVTNVVIVRNDYKMALLSNYEFAEIINKNFSIDNGIGDSLKLYLVNGYSGASPWYSQISRYIISDSLYQQISRASPCKVYLKYFDKGYPRDSIYPFEEIRTAAAYLIKNNVSVSPDALSYYSIGKPPCERKKRKKGTKQQQNR